MTDKIIIDGVDVSGCEYRCDVHKTLLADGRIKEYKNYCQITNDGCYAINCYYKTLKRKEKECEELTIRLNELTSDVNVENCPHRVFNGEYIGCRYYENQKCAETDFTNCMFRENARLKQQLQAEKEKVEELEKQLSETKFFDLFADEIMAKLNTNEMLANHFQKLTKYKQALEEIRIIASSNLCDDDCDECPSNCECDWKDVSNKIDEVLDV